MMPTERSNEALIERFTSTAPEIQGLCFAVRDVGLQRAIVPEAERICEDLRNAKRKAIEANAEHEANLLLGLECLARAVKSELLMWIALADRQPHSAWDALVEAQEHALLALRTPAFTPGAQGYTRRLLDMEYVLFPRLTFQSIGLTHTGGICSICGERFQSCPHVECAIYCGTVCAEVMRGGIEIDHASLVDVPEDKRCYIQDIEVEEGAWRDVMTQMPSTRQHKSGDSRTGGRGVAGTLMTTRDLPGVKP